MPMTCTSCIIPNSTNSSKQSLPLQNMWWFSTLPNLYTKLEPHVLCFVVLLCSLLLFFCVFIVFVFVVVLFCVFVFERINVFVCAWCRWRFVYMKLCCMCLMCLFSFVCVCVCSCLLLCAFCCCVCLCPLNKEHTHSNNERKTTRKQTKQWEEGEGRKAFY